MKDQKISYKQLRTTVVLAMHSHYLTTMTDNSVLAALSNVARVNYDLEGVGPADLEAIFAHFDDAVTARVLDEYEFVPSLGNIRDNGRTIAHCSLCGKGDSRDDGENSDKLRYEFKLSNMAGGEAVWCGSTCIINHALKVAGAATADEARDLLQKALREHMKAWMREAWRADNPDHESIPGLVRIAQRECLIEEWRESNEWAVELALMGFEPRHFTTSYRSLFSRWGRGSNKMRNAARFYEREQYLTPSKHDTWIATRRLLVEARAFRCALLAAENAKLDGETRVEHFRKAGRELREALGLPEKEAA